MPTVVSYSVSVVMLRHYDLLLLGRMGVLISRPFTSVSSNLNFFVGPCQILSLSTITSYGHFPPRHCDQVSQDSMRCDFSLFSCSQWNSVSNPAWYQIPTANWQLPEHQHAASHGLDALFLKCCSDTSCSCLRGQGH